MAGLWCDDFKGYGNTPALMLDGLYATANCTLIEDPDPMVSGTVLRMNDFFASVRKVLPAPQPIVGQAFRLWLAALPSSGNIPSFVRFSDGANVTHVSLTVTSTGVIQAYRGNILGAGGTLLGSTTGPVLTANAWNHVEVKSLISDTVGTVEVRVNGVTVLNLANKDTANSADLTIAQVELSNNNGFDGTPRIDGYFKDWFVWDTTGAYNNNFAGTVSVIALVPNSDVALTWALSSGAAGFSLVNESPPVDTSFISAATPPPAVDKMGMTNLPSDITSVRALMTLARARKTDGGDGNLQVGLISGASVDLGANRPLTTAFTYYSDFSEEDPATAAPWLPAAVDAANIQFNRTL
jgi:hypothetical protein